jgi:hypothetical protein
MRNLLNEIWTMLGEHPEFETEKNGELLRHAVECEEALTAVLNDEQMELFFKYMQASDELSAESERAAFIKGVKFAGSFSPKDCN